ncbi:MAG: hypothetical protein K0R57_5793 [Paenibacillaceae bacterium]|jgi:hypothetical protein|nr:hypothetical protein [Paenibacillaceae bacterium]
MGVGAEEPVARPAWVTPDGILFGGEYYSCRLAVREDWYRRALMGEPWMIQVISQSGRADRVYIEAEQETEQAGSDSACYALGKVPQKAGPAGNPDVEAYQEKLRRLQDERRFMRNGSLI